MPNTVDESFEKLLARSDGPFGLYYPHEALRNIEDLEHRPNEKSVERDKNGKLVYQIRGSESSCKWTCNEEGKLDGAFELSGRLGTYKCTFRNDRVEDGSFVCNKDGRPVEYCGFTDGNPSGLYALFSQNGKKVVECRFEKNGRVMNGSLIGYDGKGYRIPPETVLDYFPIRSGIMRGREITPESVDYHRTSPLSILSERAMAIVESSKRLQAQAVMARGRVGLGLNERLRVHHLPRVRAPIGLKERVVQNLNESAKARMGYIPSPKPMSTPIPRPVIVMDDEQGSSYRYIGSVHDLRTGRKSDIFHVNGETVSRITEKSGQVHFEVEGKRNPASNPTSITISDERVCEKLLKQALLKRNQNR